MDASVGVVGVGTAQDMCPSPRLSAAASLLGEAHTLLFEIWSNGMKRGIHACLALNLAFSLASAAAGQTYQWWLGAPTLQNEVTSLSADGTVAVVGGARWSSIGGTSPLPPAPEPGSTQPQAQLVSGDGSVMVGTYQRPPQIGVEFQLRGGTYRDIRWVNYQFPGGNLPNLRAISFDGSQVLLHQTPAGETSEYAKIWRENGPEVTLVSGATSALYAFAANLDYSMVVVSRPGGCFARVTDVTDYNFAPPPTPETSWTVRVQTVNLDGTIMVGQASWPLVPYRWDNHIPAPFPSLVGLTLAMSPDGSTILTNQTVWTPANNAMSHRKYLTSRGATIVAGPVTIALASADFSTFAGIGPGPTGMQRFIIQFRASPCDSIDYNNDGLLPDTTDIDQFLRAFSGLPCGSTTCNDIDFNNDGLFPDVADIDAFLRVFSGGAC